jgi:RNA polymerase sigma-70 factor (ECF subfamily)
MLERAVPDDFLTDPPIPGDGLRHMDARADIRDLLDAARRGAPDALGQIFEAARGHLLLLADHELPRDLRAKIGPSDVVQETAADAHRDFMQFTGTTPEECFAWLRKILRHNVIDAVRHYKEALKRNAGREVRIADRPATDRIASIESRRSPDASAIRREEAAFLGDVLARLPAEYRRVLQLRYWSGMSFAEMAPALERSPEAARKLWYRAIERLHTELALVNDEPTTGTMVARHQD